MKALLSAFVFLSPSVVFAIDKVDKTSDFISHIDLSMSKVLILSIGAGLLTIAFLLLVIIKALKFFGMNVYVEGHGFIDKATYLHAMEDVQRQMRRGAFSSMSDRRELARYRRMKRKGGW